MTLISTHRSFHYGLITFTLTIIIFTLMGQPAFADSPGKKSGSDPNSDNNNLYDQQASFSPSMGVIIIVLIAALFFMGFFSIYIRHCSGSSTTSGGLSRRGGVLGAVARSVRGGPRGLDRAVVDSFPTFSYAAVKELKVGKGALECAVCLNEFEDDDTLRLIPTCDHVFHPQCIDEWLVGHTTCPVCRTNLADGGASFHAPPEASGDATVVEVIEQCDDVITADDHENSNNPEERESMEAPLHGMGRSRTVRSGSVGRPRWFERFTRSFSTGHVAIEQWERFTLRLPEDVRKQVMSGQLDRSSSLVALPRETSSRRGYRTGFGEGSRSTRATHRFGSLRVDRGSARSDRWVFSLAPPFFSRVPSLRSPKVAAEVGGRHGSVRGESINQLPV